MQAEEMARELYEIREALAPEYGQAPLPITFDDLPEEAKRLLVATTYFFLDRHVNHPYCPHRRIVLKRREVAQCVDCGMLAPRQGGYGHLVSPEGEDSDTEMP
jgi:hypothetical protein